MNGPVILDVVVGLILLAAAVSGWRHGLLRSAFSAIGLIAGGVAAYLLLPNLSMWAPAPEWRAVMVIAGGVLLLIAGQAIGALVGRMLSAGVSVIKLTVLDRLAGFAVSAVVAALVLATVAGGVSSMGIPAVTQTIAGSKILGSIDGLTPDPIRSFLANVRTSAMNDALPWVIDTIAPPSYVPPSANVDAGSPALTAAAASVVRITGTAAACGVSMVGSGFVVSDDRVVTNAHVVAGVNEAVIEAPGEPPRAATVVYFDPATDIAILSVTDLDAAALPLGNQLTVGDGAALQGFPFGGPFSSLPATVAAVSVIDRSDGTSGREVYTIAADVNQGNSGGPLLDLNGSVVGVIFAKSAVADDIGYALTLQEVAPVVAAAPSLSAPVSSGACVTP